MPSSASASVSEAPSTASTVAEASSTSASTSCSWPAAGLGRAALVAGVPPGEVGVAAVLAGPVPGPAAAAPAPAAPAPTAATRPAEPAGRRALDHRHAHPERRARARVLLVVEPLGRRLRGLRIFVGDCALALADADGAEELGDVVLPCRARQPLHEDLVQGLNLLCLLAATASSEASSASETTSATA